MTFGNMVAGTVQTINASAASYFFALAAITGGTITVEGLGSESIQGDLAFVDILEHTGKDWATPRSGWPAKPFHVVFAAPQSLPMSRWPEPY